MASNDVKIKVSLEGDKLVVDGLSGIGESADKADSQLGKMASGGLAGAGKALVGLGAAAAAAGAALAAGVINQFAQYEQNVGGIETMFGESAAKMMQYADEAYRTVGISANEYMSQVTSFSAALLQGLGGDTEAAAEYANRAMTDMADNAAKFGSDIGMIQQTYQGFAKQNFTMLDNLKLGYGGTATEMARLINDSGVLGDTMKVTAETLDQVSFDQIISAIGIIQDEMGITGTVAAEASATISGSIGMLQASFANLLTGLGSADADVATLAGNVISSLELVITNISPVIEALGANIATLGPKLGTMIEGLVGSLATAIPVVLEAGVALVEGLVAGISTALPNLITSLMPGIVGLVSMIAEMLPVLMDAGLQAVVALGEGISSALPVILPQIATMITGLADAIVSNAPSILETGIEIIMALAEGLLNALPILIGYLPTLIDQIVSFINTGVPMLIEAGIELFTSLVEALPTVIEQIVTVLPNLITAIVGAVVGAVPLLVDAGIQLLTSLVAALPTIIESIVGALPLILEALLGAIFGALPLLVQAGLDLFVALIGALPDIIIAIVGALPKIITSVLNALIGAIPQFIMAGVQLFVALIGALPEIIVELVSAMPTIIEAIVGAVIDSIPEMISAGGDLIRGLWEGISGAAGWLFDKIGGFVDDVMNNIGDFFGIASPSRRMRDEIGKFLPSGIGAGVADYERDAIDPIRDMNKKIMDESMKLKTSASFTADNTLTMMPMQATPTVATPVSVEAIVDPSALSSAITDSFAGMNKERTAVTLSRESVNQLTSAIVDSIRLQSRQGMVSVGG